MLRRGKKRVVALLLSAILTCGIGGSVALLPNSVVYAETNQLAFETTNFTMYKSDTYGKIYVKNKDYRKYYTVVSSNENVATVSPQTVVGNYVSITAKSLGTTTISVYDGNTLLDTCEVTVTERTIPYKSQLYTVRAGETLWTGYLRLDDYFQYSVSSSNENIATVFTDFSDSPYGYFIKGLTPGNAEIIVRNQYGQSIEIPVVVTQSEGITLSQSHVDIKLDEYGSDTYTILIENYNEKNSRDYSVSSSDDSVVYPSLYKNEITLRAEKMGTATITVSNGYGGTATCNVVVTADDIAIPSEPYRVSVGKITPTSFYIDEYGDSQLFYDIKSDNEKIAKVVLRSNPAGTTKYGDYYCIKGISQGEANILIKSSFGHSATIPVKVSKPIKQLQIDQSSIHLSPGDTKKLKSIIDPQDSIVKLLWSSSNNSVATVDENGEVSAIGKGSAVITVQDYFKTKSAQCKITVGNPKLNVSKTKIYTGYTQKLEMQGGSGVVEWKSSNTKVATVNSNGLVKAVSPGTATITAVRNGYSSKCEVTVADPKLKTTLVKNTSVKLEEFSNDTYSVTFTTKHKATFLVPIEVKNFWGSSGYFQIKLTDSSGKILQNDKIKAKRLDDMEDYYTLFFNDDGILPPGTYTYTFKNSTDSDISLSFSVIGYSKIATNAGLKKSVSTKSGTWVKLGRLNDGSPAVIDMITQNKGVVSYYDIDKNGNVYIFCSKKGTETFTLKMINGKKYKFTMVGTSGYPNFQAYLTGYNTRDNYFTVRVSNKGKNPVTIFRNNAHVEEVHYKSNDRWMRSSSSVVVDPGKTKYIRFYVNGSVTWPEYDHYTLYSSFTYEGINYEWHVWDDDSCFKLDGKWPRTYWR